MIQVGDVVIINHDNFWKLTQEIDKLKDKISRGLGQIGVRVDTSSSHSVEERGGTFIGHDDVKHLENMINACEQYEKENPVIKQVRIFNV